MCLRNPRASTFQKQLIEVERVVDSFAALQLRVNLSDPSLFRLWATAWILTHPSLLQSSLRLLRNKRDSLVEPSFSHTRLQNAPPPATALGVLTIPTNGLEYRPTGLSEQPRRVHDLLQAEPLDFSILLRARKRGKLANARGSSSLRNLSAFHQHLLGAT